MRIYRSQIVQDTVLKNLLSAHERIANSGSVSDLIRLSKYLLRLANKRDDELVNSIAEDN